MGAHYEHVGYWLITGRPILVHVVSKRHHAPSCQRKVQDPLSQDSKHAVTAGSPSNVPSKPGNTQSQTTSEELEEGTDDGFEDEGTELLGMLEDGFEDEEDEDPLDDVLELGIDDDGIELLGILLEGIEDEGILLEGTEDEGTEDEGTELLDDEGLDDEGLLEDELLGLLLDELELLLEDGSMQLQLHSCGPYQDIILPLDHMDLVQISNVL